MLIIIISGVVGVSVLGLLYKAYSDYRDLFEISTALAEAPYKPIESPKTK